MLFRLIMKLIIRMYVREYIPIQCIVVDYILREKYGKLFALTTFQVSFLWYYRIYIALNAVDNSGKNDGWQQTWERKRIIIL